MYKKIYINTGYLDKPEELSTYSFLFNETNIESIWNYAMVGGRPLEGKIYDVAILEIFLFHCYLRKKGYKEEQIEIIQNIPLFIFNEDLYKIENENCIKMETYNVGFFSIRGSKWDFPFFHILKKIIDKKSGKCTRTNYLNSHIHGKGKFYALHNLYNVRKETIGDIVIPINIFGKDKEIFKNFLKENLSKHIVVKKDFFCAGEGVFAIDLENYTEDQKIKFEKSIDNNGSFSSTSYILPYYDFEEEFRFYFTNDTNGLRIYSFKRKRILSSKEDILKTENFRYFKNVKIKWEYIEKKEHNKYEDIFEYAKKHIKNLGYETGTFECGKTCDGKIIFFEVNSMSASICFEGEDEINMTNYYSGVFDFLLEK